MTTMGKTGRRQSSPREINLDQIVALTTRNLVEQFILFFNLNDIFEGQHPTNNGGRGCNKQAPVKPPRLPEKEHFTSSDESDNGSYDNGTFVF